MLGPAGPMFLSQRLKHRSTVIGYESLQLSIAKLLIVGIYVFICSQLKLKLDILKTEEWIEFIINKYSVTPGLKKNKRSHFSKLLGYSQICRQNFCFVGFWIRLEALV